VVQPVYVWYNKSRQLWKPILIQCTITMGFCKWYPNDVSMTSQKPLTISSKSQFTSHVADAYAHLYDLFYLRDHPLGDLLGPADHPDKKRTARRLHDVLRDLIDELDPGPEAPSFSPEWRRHRYMVLRYLRGLTHQAVADQFKISLRQYYRVRKGIVDDVAEILWERYVAQPSARQQGGEQSEDQNSTSRVELLRLEAARLAQLGRYARIGEVVEGVLSLLQGLMRQRELNVHVELPPSLPPVSVSQELLRQMLVSTLGYLAERAERCEIRISAEAQGATMILSLKMEPPEALRISEEELREERLAELSEFAALGRCHIRSLDYEGYTIGLDLLVPIAQRTVLVVDDNRDVLQLFKGYLTAHGYHVITAQTTQDAIDKARQFRPYAITLDLMMPEQDGWELLQILLAHPETSDIPTIVCTVLKQRELAISLGATAYLEKPVTQQSLLSALQALEER